MQHCIVHALVSFLLQPREGPGVDDTQIAVDGHAQRPACGVGGKGSEAEHGGPAVGTAAVVIWAR